MDVTHRIVAGWILEERLGSGGFGEVWKARRRHVDLVRALKLVPVSSEAAFAGWRHEIGRLEALSHPNIVRFHDADIVTEDGPYHDFAWIATELCERSLTEELRRRSQHVLASAEAVRLLDEMLAALATAHAGGCVHRDIKPGNILLHSSGAWKLCDFGTARLIPQGQTHPHTAVVGTSPYMSPAAHRGVQDYAADLYALGVTVHEALCGVRLHPRPEGMTDSEYVKLILDTPPTISPRLDPHWRGLIAGLIGGARADVGAGGVPTASAAELRDQLHRAWGGLAAVAPSPPPPTLPGGGDAVTQRQTLRAAAATSRTAAAGDTVRVPTQRHPGRPAVTSPSRPGRRRRRRVGLGLGWLDEPGQLGHRIGLAALVVASLAVASVLLYALVPNALAVAAVVGTVLVVILLLMALS